MIGEEMTEMIDELIGINNHNFIVQQKPFEKGSKKAEESKQIMAILAYKGMKEGYGIYRQIGNTLTELHPDVDYPYILDLVLRFKSEEDTYSMGMKH